MISKSPPLVSFEIFALRSNSCLLTARHHLEALAPRSSTVRTTFEKFKKINSIQDIHVFIDLGPFPMEGKFLKDILKAHRAGTGHTEHNEV